jgi:hypothetical protein
MKTQPAIVETSSSAHTSAISALFLANQFKPVRAPAQRRLFSCGMACFPTECLACLITPD